MTRGVYQMPMQKYLDAPGISQSRLKAMARSPAHFRAALTAEEESSRALTIGTILHLAVFEPHLLESSYYLRPETYENKKGVVKKWNANATECKDWAAAHDDREVLVVKEHESIIGMRKSVMEHAAALAALADGIPEQCLFAPDPTTGIGLKCRADWLSGNTIVDLKSTVDASPEGFASSVDKFGYDVQAAYNLDIANWLSLGREFFLFIAVEKEPPYAVAVYELDAESIGIGRSKYRRYLDLADHCFKTDEWPAYDPAIQRLSLPQWSIRREAARHG
jgi:exodeoxyribonuclease VIII